MIIENKKRDSNIELFRIFAMLGIIAHHFAVRGGFEFPDSVITLNSQWVNFLSLWGKFGVNIFILITGYYCVPNGNNNYSIKDDFKKSIKKIVVIECVCIFWSVLLAALNNIWLFCNGEIPVYSLFINLAYSCFPVLSGEWWFASDFVLVMLLSPCINFVLNRIETRKYLKLICCALLFSSLIPTIFFSMEPIIDSLPHLIVMYCLGGYLRRSNQRPARAYIMIAIISFLIMYGGTLAFKYLGLRYQTFSGLSTHLYKMYSLPMVVFSASVLMIFIQRSFYNSIINKIATTTFGVYLIHDSNLGRTVFWEKVFNVSVWQDSKFLWLYSIAVISLTFCICMIAEMIREKSLARPQRWFMSKVSDLLDREV